MDMPVITATRDWAAIAALHAQIPDFGDRPDAAHFAARCGGPDGRGWIAHCAGKPAGYVTAYDRYSDGSLYCWMAGTVPTFRRCGVLTALMTALETTAQAEAYRCVRIKTRIRWRAMRSWLKAHDYRVTAIDKRRPLADSRIELVKELERYN